MRHIITSGDIFTDIDGLASVIAYTELLTYEKKDAVALLSGKLNHSIPNEVMKWELKYLTSYNNKQDEMYIVVDTSDPTYLEHFLPLGRVGEIYDHHFGYENYWVSKLGDNSHIEKVGACATLIVEQLRQRTKNYNLSSKSANLLAWAIISNTLNFRASVTDQRDIVALEYLQPFTNLQENWVEKYFINQDSLIYADPIGAIKNDTKIVTSPLISGNIAIAQLELWEGKSIMAKYRQEIESMSMQAITDHWLLTIPYIKEGYNFIYAVSDQIKDVLEAAIGATFDGNVGTTKQLFLRKEIMREIKA